MLLIVLAHLGGAMIILSPCILPLLPYVFARLLGGHLPARLREWIRRRRFN